MNFDVEKVKKQIMELIEHNYYKEAIEFLQILIEEIPEYIEFYSMYVVSLTMQGNIEKAINIAQKGLAIDLYNFDLLYNLAYLYMNNNELSKALTMYEDALLYCNEIEIQDNIKEIIRNLECEYNIVKAKKIVFFSKPGMDSFLKDVVKRLDSEFICIKIDVSNNKSIDIGMEWADICWFEWCDDLIVYGSKCCKSGYKKIICRLHSYEAFTEIPKMVNWDNVDILMVDTKHILDILLSSMKINEEIIRIIPVGIQEENFKFKERNKGYNIGYLGYINYKKGPMLLIQLISQLKEIDKKYKLYLGGVFQDKRYELYFKQMIEELNLEENLILDGWIENTDNWLEDKNYVISSSLLEGQHLSIMEGMAKGIKPIIHNFYGAKEVYNKKYIWNTISEAINMITSDEYKSNEYRNFVLNKYSNQNIFNNIKEMINNDLLKNDERIDEPLVTIGIPNYNYSCYLKDCVDSIMKQTYKNIEIIIIDDNSTDNSRELILELSKKYSNISYIFHSENSGACLKAINETIVKARGEYLLSLSADDILCYDNAIKDIIEVFKKDKLDYVYGNFSLFNNENKITGVWKYNQYNSEEIIRETFNRGGSGIMPLTAGIYKMSFFRENKIVFMDYMNNKVAWDTLNTLINIKYDIRFKYVNKSFIGYRYHGNNMTNNLKDRVTSLISNIEYIVNNFSEDIYLFSNEYNSLPIEEKEAYKYFKIGQVYCNEIKNIYLNKWNPFKNDMIDSNDPTDIREWVQPMEERIDYYFHRCKEVSTFFDENINDIYRSISKIIKNRA